MEIKELKEEAQELLDFGNSHDKAEGKGMMKVLNAIEGNFVPNWRSVSWSVYDFEGRAKEIWKIYKDEKRAKVNLPVYTDAKNWKDVFDKTKFNDALERMVSKHDATIGITWETIDFYLDDMCLKNIS